MTKGTLEHVNITVTDPKRSAKLFMDLCGWRIRWEGPSMAAGYTIHVGNDDTYLALYTNPASRSGHPKGQPMSHVGILVENLDEAERVVTEAGFKSWGHDDYEPGRRFYFYDHDGIEFEVINYE